MRVSFDLDDTLIPSADMPSEPAPFLARLILREPLSIGALPLLRELRAQGHEVWIYTTSLRLPLRIRLAFLAMGIRLGGVVNQRTHDQAMESQPDRLRGVSKYPPAFGIDLHVDDSEGVLIEGERHGFLVIRVDIRIDSWPSTVREAVATRAA